MSDLDLLANLFDEQRMHLFLVAYRMLGSNSEAEDAVQETWLRLHRSDASTIDNLGGWMTTVVARVCLDVLRKRTARREDPLDTLTERSTVDETAPDPEQEALLADSLGFALLVVLDALTPIERVAFVLHDLFQVPFAQIAGVVNRSPEAARQLASRARRKVAGLSATDIDRRRQDALVRAFLDASRRGDLTSLIALLDPDAVIRPDQVAQELGAAQADGAEAVARAFVGRARAAEIAQVNGVTDVVWAPAGRLRAVFRFVIHHDKITAIDLMADPDLLATLDVVLSTGVPARLRERRQARDRS